MNERVTPEMIDEDNPEWTAEDINRSVPFSSLPESLRRKLGDRPRPAPSKPRVAVRLSPEVVEIFRATGKGWQNRMDQALADWLKTHSPAGQQNNSQTPICR